MLNENRAYRYRSQNNKILNQQTLWNCSKGYFFIFFQYKNPKNAVLRKKINVVHS